MSKRLRWHQDNADINMDHNNKCYSCNGNRRCSRACCRDSLQVLLLIAGVLAGVALGVSLRLFTHTFSHPELHPREMMYLYFPAEIFIRFLTFIMVPFMATSLISGFGLCQVIVTQGSLDAHMAGKLGFRTLLYYISTTTIAVTEGFIYVYAVRPGHTGTKKSELTSGENEVDSYIEEEFNFNRIDSLLDMIRNIFPDNIVKVCFELYSTTSTMRNFSRNESEIEIETLGNDPVDAVNILGLTVNSILFGIGLVYIKKQGRIVLIFVEVVFSALLKILLASLWLYPIAILSMIATSVVQVADPINLLQKMIVFLATVLLGLFCHTIFVLPAIYLIFRRKNPYKYMWHCGKALLTAFVTSNSAMTIPVSMQCLENAKIHPAVIRFMIPIGATINMDGFALYESLSCIFIATLNGMNPGIVEVLTVGLTAVTLSIGAPTAGSGIVIYVILFKSIGLPLRDIALLVPFDWLMGRFRTMVNVWGDCVGAAIVSDCCKHDLVLQASQEVNNDVISHATDEDVPETHPMLAHDTSLTKSNDWTVRLENESGDKLVISQV